MNGQAFERLLCHTISKVLLSPYKNVSFVFVAKLHTLEEVELRSLHDISSSVIHAVLFVQQNAGSSGIFKKASLFLGALCSLFPAAVGLQHMEESIQ